MAAAAPGTQTTFHRDGRTWAAAGYSTPATAPGSAPATNRSARTGDLTLSIHLSSRARCQELAAHLSRRPLTIPRTCRLECRPLLQHGHSNKAEELTSGVCRRLAGASDICHP